MADPGSTALAGVCATDSGLLKRDSGVLDRLLANGDVEWDAFDSDAYFAKNYGYLRDDDAQIIEIVADFFHTAAPVRWRAKALDVGTGANLYPAMTMLPFAGELSLVEPADSNRNWLASELARPHGSWTQFWSRVSAQRPEYERIKGPFDLLRHNAEIHKGSVFSLPANQFDLGTMFFVAESITTRRDEFQKASRSFVRSLLPRAPFAAAFMRNSVGYSVGGQDFPACAVTEEDVQKCLAEDADIKHIQIVESRDLREGYSGMIVATGWKKVTSPTGR